MSTKGLTEAQIAALAAGLPLNAGTPETPAALAAREAAEAAQAETVRLAAEAEAARVVAEAAAGAADPKAEGSPDPAPAAKSDSEIVLFLKGQIAEKDTALMNASIATKALETKLSSVETTHEALLGIARGAVANMRVALGGSAADAEALSDLNVVAEHKSLSEQFKKKFKVGGVTAPAAEAAEASAPAANSKHMARVSAAKTRK